MLPSKNLMYFWEIITKYLPVDDVWIHIQVKNVNDT